MYNFQNKLSDVISISYLLQDSETEVTPDKAIFIGECYLPWKDILTRNGEWLQQRVALADPMGKCPEKVRGMVKIYVKWIPAGSEKSKYNEDGSKKEVAVPVNVPNKREQMLGAQGTLEAYVIKYTHPN